MTNFLIIENTDISHLIAQSDPELEIIWDDNAGRTVTADFVGDIVGKKWKISVTTKMLTQRECAEITNIIMSKPFLSVSFIPTTSVTGTPMTRTFYVSSPSYKVYSYETKKNYKNMMFDLIEQ